MISIAVSYAPATFRNGVHVLYNTVTVTKLVENGALARGGPDGAQAMQKERSLIEDLKRHTQLTVAWSRQGSLVPRWT
jgi:hypothetical protein